MYKFMICMLYVATCSASFTPGREPNLSYAVGHHNHWGHEELPSFQQPVSPRVTRHQRVESEVLPDRAAMHASPDIDSTGSSNDSGTLLDAIIKLFPSGDGVSGDSIKRHASAILSEDQNSPLGASSLPETLFRRVRSGSLDIDNSNDKHYLSLVAIKASHRAMLDQQKHLEEKQAVLEVKQRKIDERFSKKGAAAMAGIASVVCSAIVAIATNYSEKKCS